MQTRKHTTGIYLLRLLGRPWWWVILGLFSLIERGCRLIRTGGGGLLSSFRCLKPKRRRGRPRLPLRVKFKRRLIKEFRRLTRRLGRLLNLKRKVNRLLITGPLPPISWGWLKHLLFSFGGVVIVSTSLFSVWFYFSFLSDLPPVRQLSTPLRPLSSQVYDRNKVLLYTFYETENRTPIKLKDLPSYVPQAIIAIEDQNFYHHAGIDIAGIARAFVTNIKNEALVQGGSTITQQLVKNTLLSPERTLKRKIKEAVLCY